MSVGSDLKRMGRFLEAVETTAGSIRTVEFVAPAASGTSPGIDIEVAVTLGEAAQPGMLSPTKGRIDAAGRIRLELESDGGFIPDIDGVTVTMTNIEIHGSGGHGRQGHYDGVEDTHTEPNRSMDTSAGEQPQPTITVCLRAEPVNAAANRSSDDVEASTQHSEAGNQPGMRGVTATTDGGTTTTTTTTTSRDHSTVAEAAEPAVVHVTEPDDSKEAEAKDADATDRSVPPFRDPELLADVYERCETFAEMSEAIDMDVTGETVRRYMIDHGIHEPNAYGSSTDGEETSAADGNVAFENHSASEATDDTAACVEADTPKTENSVQADDTDQPPILATDGFGIHEQVTVDELAETIARSNTVYDVKRELGLGRAETRDLLETLDLIDLVVGRLTTAEQRKVDRDRILDRLRSAAEPEPEPGTPSVAH